MKKVISPTLLMLVAIQPVLGQGVYFVNRWGFERIPFFDDQHVFLSGSNYVAQLYAGSEPNSLRRYGTPVAFFDGTNSGYFSGGVVELTNFAPCSSPWAQVRAWQSDGRSTFEAAARNGAWTGVSSIVHLPYLSGCGAGVPLPPPHLDGLQYPGDPIFVSYPQGGQVRAGESFSLSIVASGGITLYYQWYAGLSGDTNSPISGATNAVNQTPPLTQDVQYWVRAWTDVGAVESETVSIKVHPADTLFLELYVADEALRTVLHAPPGNTYQLQQSSELLNPAWTTITNLLLPTSPFELTLPRPPDNTPRFYRLFAE